MAHRSQLELDMALDTIEASPRDEGIVELIVRRPGLTTREVLEKATLDVVVGLVGDSWSVRPARKRPDRSPDPEMQITLMNVRSIAAIAGDREHWPLAGDNLFVDLRLAVDNVPAGTRLAVGSAVLEATAAPHKGCKKFSARFGTVATRWANTPRGRSLNLRGIHAKVVVSGTVRRGDRIRVMREPGNALV